MEKRKGKKEKEEIMLVFNTKKVKLKPGTRVSAGQLLTSDEIEAPNKNKLIESIAKFLWMKYDKTRLTDDWNRETPQRQLRWTTDAESVRQLVDEYYEE